MVSFGVANQRLDRLAPLEQPLLVVGERLVLAAVKDLYARVVCIHASVTQIDDDLPRAAPQVLQQVARLLELGTQNMAVVRVADDPDPSVAVRVRVDCPQSSIHEFTDSQACGIGEVQQEPQPLRGRLAPAVGPLQAVGDDPNELPLVEVAPISRTLFHYEKESEMPTPKPPYLAAFRQQIVELVRAGRGVSEVARLGTPWSQARKASQRSLVWPGRVCGYAGRR